MLTALLRSIKWAVIVTALGLLFVAFAPNLPPYDMAFDSKPLGDNPPFEGQLATNYKLNKAELLTDKVKGSHLGFIKGAEGFTFKDGFLYTGIQGGDIIRLNMKAKGAPLEGTWESIAKTGKSCSGVHDEVNCGKPLGMDFDPKTGALIVCDAYHGLIRIDVKTGKKEVLVSPEKEIEGARNTLTNSVTIDKKGKAYYFTTSSTRYGYNDGFMEFMTNGTGRLMRYDVATKAVTVLMNGLSFGNGLALSPKEDFVLVNDIGRFRIWKHNLVGPKAGTTEVFTDLPGAPDNMKATAKGRYLVGLPAVDIPGSKVRLLPLIKSQPLLARFMLRLVTLAQLGAEFLNSVMPHEAFEMAAHHIGHCEHAFGPFKPQAYGMVVELDQDGKVTNSWQSPDGQFHGFSEGYLHTDGYIYLGSPFSTYIARVKYDEK